MTLEDVTDKVVKEVLGSALVQVFFTPMEQLLIRVLSDGQRHDSDFLVKQFNDSEADRSNLHAHVKNIRRKIRPLGHDLICELKDRRLGYRYVVLLSGLVLMSQVKSRKSK